MRRRHMIGENIIIKIKLHKLFEFSIEATMDIFKGHYYSLNYKLFLITGQWPYLSKTQKVIRLFMTIMVINSILIPMSLALPTISLTMNSITEAFPPIVITIVTLAVNLVVIIKFEMFKTLLEKVEESWMIWSKEPEIEIIKKQAEYGRLFRLAYTGTMLASSASFLAMPTLPLILDYFDPLDNGTRPRVTVLVANYGKWGEEHFYIIFVFTYVMSLVSMLLLFHSDMTFMIFTHHACGVLKAIGAKLSNLVEDSDDLPDHGAKFQEHVETQIIFCVKRHRELIDFLQILHKFCSNLFLFVLVLNMIVMSISGVQTVMNLRHPVIAIRFSASTFAQVLHLFCITVPCQEMMDASSDIPVKVYDSKWYLLPVQTRRLLLMIMRRSSEPLNFVAGKMFMFSMENFAMVLKTSISYFTVLTSLQ